MEKSESYHASYYSKNKARLQKYQRNYYHTKMAEKENPDLPNTKKWIKIKRGSFLVTFE